MRKHRIKFDLVLSSEFLPSSSIFTLRFDVKSNI